MARSAKQVAAQKKASAASARKRRRGGRKRKIAGAIAGAAVIGGVAYAAHKGKKHSVNVKVTREKSSRKGFAHRKLKSPQGTRAEHRISMHTGKNRRHKVHVSYNTGRHLKMRLSN